MTPAITLDELIAELERSSNPQSGGFTFREMMDAMNCGERHCRTLLRQAIQSGRVRPAGQKAITDMAGRKNFAPCYQMIQ